MGMKKNNFDTKVLKIQYDNKSTYNLNFYFGFLVMLLCLRYQGNPSKEATLTMYA